MLIYAFLNGVEIHWVRISTLFGDDQHLAYINTFIADPKLPDDEVEDPEDSEEEYIVKEEDGSEEEEIEDDDEYVDDRVPIGSVRFQFGPN